ncbi:necrosis and ethylene-inducing protein-inducing protein [Rhypophila sp. PSN 637]
MFSRQNILLALTATALPLSQGLPELLKKRENPPPGPLFLNAPALDKRFAPALDFDTDSCYNTPAIGPNGDLATGLDIFGVSPTAGCREEVMLERCNVYSRQRCNNGYCAIMYAYYFQKDWASPGAGHRHDWEHVVVWVRMSDQFVSHVAVSQHKGYEIKANHEISWTAPVDGHPAVVYHKDGGSTHAFRFANGADFGNGGPENHWRQWIMGPLIGYFGWESAEQRDRMFTNDWGSASLAIKNEKFAENLGKALPKNAFAFDVNHDDDITNRI